MSSKTLLFGRKLHTSVIIAGIVQVLLSEKKIAKWVGMNQGFEIYLPLRCWSLVPKPAFCVLGPVREPWLDSSHDGQSGL